MPEQVIGDQGSGHEFGSSPLSGPLVARVRSRSDRKTDTSNESREHLLDRAEDLKRNHVDAEQRYVDKTSQQETITVSCES
jgi:hypothetical protein